MRRGLQQFVLPRFMAPPMPQQDPDTLVIHIRSGDVMNSKASGSKYWEPPLKFYKHIIRKYHNDAPILIITEKHIPSADGTGGNPVVEALLAWRPKQIMFPPAHLLNDLGAALGTVPFCVTDYKVECGECGESFSLSLSSPSPTSHFQHPTQVPHTHVRTARDCSHSWAHRRLIFLLYAYMWLQGRATLSSPSAASQPCSQSCLPTWSGLMSRASLG